MSASNPRSYLVFCLGAFLIVSMGGFARAQTEVKVVNQPDVAVPRPIPHSHLTEFTNIPIPGKGILGVPLSLDAEGFTHVMLSLAVEVQGLSPSSGSVTATLIPNTPIALRALELEETHLFPMVVSTAIQENEK